MKVTKAQIKNLNEFIAKANEDGVLMSSQWTSGTGRFVSKRAIPPFCTEVNAREAAKSSRRVASYLVQHPKCVKVIVVDWNALEMWKNDEFTKGEELLG